MAASTTFGASVVPSENTHQGDGTLHRPNLTLDTPELTPVVSRSEFGADSPYLDKPPPNSPFYMHPPASFERVHTPSTGKLNISNRAYTEKELENGNCTPLTLQDDENPFASKVSVDCNKECKMWPSKQTLMQSKLAEKKQKRDRKGCAGCGMVKNRWASWNKKEQLIAKLILAAIVVGIIVAIAVGVTVAVNGTVYGNSGAKPVGQSQH